MDKSNTHSRPHITPLKVYLGVGALLFIMTIVTVTAASIDFGAANILIALAIAGFKALMVAFFFMHLWYDNKLYFLVFGSSLAFLAIFIGLTMFDTERRAEIYDIKAQPIEAKAIIYQHSPDTVAAAIPVHSDPTNVPTDTVKGDAKPENLQTQAPQTQSQGQGH